MPSQLSTVSRASSSRYHKLQISNLNGGIFRVASCNATTITFDDISDLLGTTLYAAGTPGMAVIVEGVAAGDEGKTANITGISGNVATVNVDLSAALADGDLVAIVPPMGCHITTNGGHTIAPRRTHDTSMGLGESVLTHNTALQVDVGGNIPLFAARDSQALARVILAGTGLYKKSATGTHQFRPSQVNDASSTFAAAKDFCAYSKDGDGIVEQVFLGLMASQLDLNFPNLQVANANLQVLGSHAIREVSGSGKTFPSGTSNWDRGTGIERDSGNRHVYNGVFVEFGGSFGAALGDHDHYVLDAAVAIRHGLADDYPLGSQDRAIPIEDTFGITVTGRRILQNDTIYQDFFGASTSATPGQSTTTRLHLKAISPGDATKHLDIDIPLGKWTVDDVVRQRGRFVESFTFEGIQTVASGDYDAANPLYQIELKNGNDVDLLAAL